MIILKTKQFLSYFILSCYLYRIKAVVFIELYFHLCQLLTFVLLDIFVVVLSSSALSSGAPSSSAPLSGDERIVPSTAAPTAAADKKVVPSAGAAAHKKAVPGAAAAVGVLRVEYLP